MVPKKTFCFGAGRENFTKTVINASCLKADEANPGPGTYVDRTRNVGVNARKWSLQSRNDYHDDTRKALKKGIPGPGTYENVNQISPRGQYHTSNFL